MLVWKIVLDMPQLAYVALPQCSSVCIMLCALAADTVLVVALPLVNGKSCTLLSFRATGTRTFFAIFG